jgi:hypothetical protein
LGILTEPYEACHALPSGLPEIVRFALWEAYWSLDVAYWRKADMAGLPAGVRF